MPVSVNGEGILSAYFPTWIIAIFGMYFIQISLTVFNDLAGGQNSFCKKYFLKEKTTQTRKFVQMDLTEVMHHCHFLV